MRCSRCLNEVHHPFTLSGHDGICFGCITHGERQGFSEARLARLFSEIKRKGSSRNYDCIIPVRGDADDYYVVKLALDYGLNPLITIVNSYYFNDIGWHNIQNLITHFDVDSVTLNADLQVYKDLVRYSITKYSCALLPYKFLFYSFPVRQALQKKVPFILYGENQPIEQTGNFSNFDEVEKNIWLHKEFDFDGKTIDDFLQSGGLYNPEDLYQYNFPDKLAHKVVGVYLSQYVDWDPVSRYQDAVAQGFQPQVQKRTFDFFHRAGSSIYYEAQDFLRLKKHGYLKVRDHLNREIRFQRISRDYAEEQYEAYLALGFNLSPFYDWLEVSKSGRKWLDDRVFRIDADQNIPLESSSVNLSSVHANCAAEAKEDFLIFSKQLYI